VTDNRCSRPKCTRRCGENFAVGFQTPPDRRAVMTVQRMSVETVDSLASHTRELSQTTCTLVSRVVKPDGDEPIENGCKGLGFSTIHVTIKYRPAFFRQPNFLASSAPFQPHRLHQVHNMCGYDRWSTVASNRAMILNRSPSRASLNQKGMMPATCA
jgi:hypothetical protein